MHHVLLAVFFAFILGMLIISFFRDVIEKNNRLKSEISQEELLNLVEKDAISYAKALAPELNLSEVKSADFYFFKNKRELAIILKDTNKDHLIQLSFKNLSPGYGLREKIYELTPSEGIYQVDYAGYTKKEGLFVRVLYPPESFKDYQKIKFEELQKDPYLIAEKPSSASFIQTESDFMKLFTYLIAKLNKDNIKILIYPDRPPIEMELGGTEFLSEIYQKLDGEYNKLKELIETLKPKI